MVKTYDLDVATVSGLFFLLAVSIVISQAVTFNYLHKLLPAREIIKKILPAISICVLLLMFYHIPGVGPNVLILTLVVMVFAMLYALVLPAFSVVFTEEAGKTGHGHSLGIVSSAQAFASSVGPLLGGFLVGIFYELPIVVCAILILLSLKLFKVWEKE
jgi:MFS family permease